MDQVQTGTFIFNCKQLPIMSSRYLHCLKQKKVYASEYTIEMRFGGRSEVGVWTLNQKLQLRVFISFQNINKKLLFIFLLNFFWTQVRAPPTRRPLPSPPYCFTNCWTRSPYLRVLPRRRKGTRIQLKFKANFLENEARYQKIVFYIFVLFWPVESPPRILTISRVIGVPSCIIGSIASASFWFKSPNSHRFATMLYASASGRAPCTLIQPQPILISGTSWKVESVVSG